MAALRACTALFPDLDPDILEYIVGLLEDDSETMDAEEMAETIAGFLLSADFCATDEEAAAKTSELFARLGSGDKAAKAPARPAPSKARKKPPAAAPKLKEEKLAATKTATREEVETEMSKVTIGEDDKSDTVAAQAPALPVKEVKEQPPTAPKSNKEKRSLRDAKKQKSKNRKKKLNATEQAEADAFQLEAELHAARLKAVKARNKLGAYKGALDATSFTLPNPGGGRPLLEDAACTLVWGKRFGLIGRNGCGKSTMLRAFAARRVGDVPENVTVHYVSQEVNLTKEQSLKTPVECVVEADLERTLLLEELALIEVDAEADKLDAKGSKRHGEVLSRLDEIGSDSAERRATTLLENLGFSLELRSRPLLQLSGGWRVRTMLAAAIFAAPDMLLLDEPTNHLSILAVMWLARELATSETWKERIVIIVSHDRHFMDEVCTDCLHISGAAKRLTQCRGNYSKWAKQRKEQQVLFAKQQEHRQEEIDKLKEYAGHGFKFGGSSSQINKMSMKAKQADKLEEIHEDHAEELAALQEDIELPMNILAGGELDGFIVQLLDVGFGYPNSTPARLFEHVEFGITSKSRIVLLGENGQGKTTLVKLIMGELEPCEGEVRRSPHARYAKVDQHHADQIDLSMTPLQFLAKQYPGDGSYEHMQTLRGHLSSCGVTSGSGNNKLVPDLQNTPASALSGGQRSRVALASVSFARPHVLVLDEPTNNLDLESVAALAESVQQFKGAVICVSHDQFFVQAVANEAWVVTAGKVKQVASFETYRNRQLQVLNKNSN
jgi:ATP-binding cassette subfamily F protein 3